MLVQAKRLTLYLLKLIGIFYFSRLLTKGALRILCYHGFSLREETQFWPGVFMPENTFGKHMEILLKQPYQVINLQDALSRMQTNPFPPYSVVITFDDGFFSIYKEAVPYLLRRKLPATIYVTTYYCLNQNPIFRLVVQYMFWKTHTTKIDIADLGLPPKGLLSMEDRANKRQIMWQIIEFGEAKLDEPARCRMAKKLGDLLAVSYQDILESRCFSIMNLSEIEELVSKGIDIQLHTHRHVFPEDAETANRELRDNRAVLEPITRKPLKHFCYPSGIWSRNHFAILKDAGIDSAVTCDPGFNNPNTHRLALKRYLVGSNVSKIEFEAELCGLKELLRRLKFPWLTTKSQEY
ncbi:MAG TPA: hypothetical protein ENO27_01235 [Caldithrix sp.]|nr:hypothetical protein [Caldithrix sp.]